MIKAGYTYKWASITNIPSQQFTCGHCGREIASEHGWVGLSTYDSKPQGYVAVFHFCQRPTFLDDRGRQFPSAAPGGPVEGVTDTNVSALYDEARRASSAGSFTAAVLCCRKLLMHIAVSKGAKANQTFVQYVEYLADKSYIPPDAKSWVDHIRTKSNEANHEIVILSIDDAVELVSFSEMLLKVIFEFPSRIQRKTLPPSLNSRGDR
jgi:hypothetical protein